MLHTFGNGFDYVTSNQTTPSQTPGTAITPGNNTFPAYASILTGANIAQDCYGMLLHISCNSTSATNRDTLLSVGADPSGGTSYTTIIPNLLCTNAGESSATGGMLGYMYYFPLFIKSGTQLAAQASVNNATVGTLRCMVKLFGQPRRPEMVKCGSYVRDYGTTTATSNGTTVTPGASGAAPATGTLLGTVATGETPWWWQTGLGFTGNTTVSSRTYFLDVFAGASTTVANDAQIINSEQVELDTTERFRKANMGWDYYNPVPEGTGIYGRMTNSGTNMTGTYSMAAYGLGG